MQLETLMQGFKRAQKSEGSVVVVTGEAGVGKTRLLTEFRDELEISKVVCAIGHCLEYAQSPFAPFLQILREIARLAPDTLIRDSIRRRVLARLLPELGEPQDDSAWVEEERRAQFEAIAAVLSSFARDAALVIFIEDLQWADTASLDQIQHLLGSTTSRLLLVGSCRSQELDRDHPTRSALARFERSKKFWKIALEPLDDIEMHALVSHALEGHGVLSEETITSICRRAEGNPLFAEELLRSAVDHPASKPGGGELPLSISQAVVERLARFDTKARGVLTTAATLGRHFRGTLLAEITGLPYADTLSIIKEARDRQLVVEGPPGDDAIFAFRHALTQEAIYRELLVGEARPLHAQIAARIEAMPDAGERVAELAYHWWTARDYKKASHYNELSAEIASRMYAFSDSVVFYERAVAAAENLGAVRPELLTKFGRSLLFAGAAERSHQVYQRVLAYYEHHGSVETIAETCIDYARICYNLGDLKSAVSMIERAILLLGDNSSSPMYFSAHVLLSYVYFREADAEKALQQLETADQFQGQRKAQDEIGFYNHRGIARDLLGDMNGALEDMQHALTVAKESGNVLYQVRLLGNMALCLTSFGQRERSETCIEEALTIAQERKVAGLFLACCLLQYAYICLNFGALERARRLVEQALATGVGEMEVEIDACSYGMTVALQLKDQSLLQRCTRADLLELAFAGNVRRQIASIAKGFVESFITHHEEDKAKALLHRVVDAFISLPDEAEEEILPYVAAFGSDGDIQPARTLLQRHVERVKRPDALGQALLFEAFASKRSGSDEASKESALRAAAVYREIKRPNHEALSLEIAGLTTQALALYREIGNVRDTRRLELALAPPKRRGRSKNELTERELQVARLIAEGKSNRAIAESLVLSERTVESHVASVFHKLSVSSRAEVATRITRDTMLSQD